MRSLRLVGLIALLFFMFGGTVLAFEEGEGYDENTELTITGTVQDVVKEGRGPVIFRVSSRERIYNVLTAPPWYLERENVNFRPGVEIEVTGSKVLGRDGSLYLISRRLKEVKTGREIELRDEFLRPLWRGRRHPSGKLSECPAMPASDAVCKG